MAKVQVLVVEDEGIVGEDVRQTLEDFVTKDRSRKAALEGLESLWQKTEAKIGKKTWTRDELHER